MNCTALPAATAARQNLSTIVANNIVKKSAMANTQKIISQSVNQSIKANLYSTCNKAWLMS